MSVPPGPAPAAPAGQQQDVSIFGVFMLSMVSVGMAIMGIVVLALAVMATWWLVSHIPVPAFVWRVLTHLGLI